MFDISPIQILIVLVIALLVFGPKRLPDLGRNLGASIRDFRGAISGVASDASPAPAETLAARDRDSVVPAWIGDPDWGDHLPPGGLLPGAQAAEGDDDAQHDLGGQAARLVPVGEGPLLPATARGHGRHGGHGGRER